MEFKVKDFNEKRFFDVEVFCDDKYITVEVKFKLVFIMKHYHQKKLNNTDRFSLQE